MAPQEERNPDCACGCGMEVRLPSNRYVLGHSGKYPHMWSQGKREFLEKAEALLNSGMSQNKVANALGVTQGTISNWFGKRASKEPSHGIALTPTFSPTIYHQSDIAKKEEKWEWQTAKRQWKKVRKHLNRNRLRSRTAA